MRGVAALPDVAHVAPGMCAGAGTLPRLNLCNLCNPRMIFFNEDCTSDGSSGTVLEVDARTMTRVRPAIEARRCEGESSVAGALSCPNWAETGPPAVATRYNVMATVESKEGFRMALRRATDVPFESCRDVLGKSACYHLSHKPIQPFG